MLLVKCVYKSCKEFDKLCEISWSGQSSIILHEEMICPSCGHLRQTLPRNTSTIEDYNSIEIGKISSMSPFERKKVLKQRSNEHYKKEIKEKKNYLDRAAIGKEK